jgi:predicted aminopeptidase
MKTNPSTKGILTSEFLTLIVAQVVGFAVLSGHVTPASADGLTTSIVDIVGALITICTAVSYIHSRVDLKKTIVNQQPPVTTVISDPAASVVVPTDPVAPVI